MSTYKGFTTVELRKPQQSRFDLSHERKLSTRMGRLTPIFISETIPNDTFFLKSEIMLRLAPLLAPIMHRVNVFVHFFFVPNRLLWKDWESFITGGRQGTETPPIPPYCAMSTILDRNKDLLDKGSVADYLGIPNIPDSASATWSTRRLDLMPFAAYYKVWYDYYRDRNFVADNTNLPLTSGFITGSVTESLMTMRKRAWQHDYFTAALPWTQRGAEVLMPLMGSGDVTYLPEASLVGAGQGSVTTNADGEIGVGGPPPSSLFELHNIDTVDITNSEVSINDLRRAVRLQEWLERNALAGSRYNESILAHFGRRTSDARLQRAEYIGGGKLPVKISEVVTTAWSQDGSANDVPPANMSGHGMGYGMSSLKKPYNCEEHGFIIGIMSVMPNAVYMQGVPRMFTNRQTFLDYPWPSFAHLGEQEVYNSEVYFDPTSWPLLGTEQPLFGYQSRYADWKYMQSTVHGDFRDGLDFWHLARKFSSQPLLGETFNTFEDTLQDRIFAVSEVDTLWCLIYNNVKVRRSLPYFGTPML